MFQQTITYIAIAVFVLLVLLIGWKMYKSHGATNQEVNWPTNVPQCPDYWVANEDGTCDNPMNLGTCNKKTMNFNVAPFTGTGATCAKFTWARNCGISWDGITYGAATNNPCT